MNERGWGTLGEMGRLGFWCAGVGYLRWKGVFADVVCIETKEGWVVGWGGGFGSICFHVLSS